MSGNQQENKLLSIPPTTNMSDTREDLTGFRHSGASHHTYLAGETDDSHSNLHLWYFPHCLLQHHQSYSQYM